jgi:hypothetical protein
VSGLCKYLKYSQTGIGAMAGREGMPVAIIVVVFIAIILIRYVFTRTADFF